LNYQEPKREVGWGYVMSKLRISRRKKLLENSPYIITVHVSLLYEKLVKKTQSGSPRSTDTWNPPAIEKKFILFGAREEKTGASSLRGQ
jgi:hypothetical protein